jgi:RNA polymerase sigma factor (sigma-70 family)
MTDLGDITAYLSGIRKGDERSAEVIWREYFTRLVRLARKKIDALPGRAVDEEDVALSAMYSFYRGMEAGRFEAVDDREDLWKILVTITARKACKQLRREYAAKRGGGSVRGESAITNNQSIEGREIGIADVIGSEPTPELACMVVENCQQLLDRLEDDTLQQIAQLTLEGYTTSEIADKLGCVRRTVERKLERIRKKWAEEGLA